MALGQRNITPSSTTADSQSAMQVIVVEHNNQCTAAASHAMYTAQKGTQSPL